MRIGNIEIGITRNPKGQWDWEWPNVIKCCGGGCLIFSVGPFYLVYLGNECR